MHIDLHTHSTASDGTDTPAELMRNAAAAGLDVVALTDHDSVRGHAEAIAALPEGLTLVTGAELSCRMDGVGLHMLAYLFDPDEPELARERELVRDDRVPRAQTMVRKLQALGVPVEWEQVARIAGDGSVGRPHIATALVELGVVETVSDAFTPSGSPTADARTPRSTNSTPSKRSGWSRPPVASPSSPTRSPSSAVRWCPRRR